LELLDVLVIARDEWDGELARVESVGEPEGARMDLVEDDEPRSSSAGFGIDRDLMFWQVGSSGAEPFAGHERI